MIENNKIFMKYFNLIVIMFVLTSCSAQKNNKLMLDNFQTISFEKHTLVLDKDSKSYLHELGKYIKSLEKESDSKFRYQIQVIPNIDEHKQNELIGFRRSNLILTFFKKNYNLNYNIFEFVYFDPIPSESLVNFIFIKDNVEN